MTSVQIIGHKKTGEGRKKKIRCCCFGAKRSSSDVSVEADLNEPYEYVVEKLVIKRVPVKRFSEPRVESSVDLKEVKPIVTFSSYCQMGPMVVNKKQLPLSLMGDSGDKGHDGEVDVMLKELGGDGDVDSPREEMTSGRREQLQQCVKNLNTAQVYKHTTSPKLEAKRKTALENAVLFTKPMSTRDADNVELPPAVKETMDLLATKQPMSSMNRRLVTRDPATGQIKEIFQNVKIEKPVRLDEIYPRQEGDSKRPKWKIIIRHRNDKAKRKLEESSSDLGMETDV